MTYYKFVTWDIEPVEKYFSARIPSALAEYDKGNKKPFQDLGIATTSPYYKIGGWCFPLFDYLNRYWVLTKYHGIIEYFAINKTAIRRELKSQCIRILEV